MSNENNNCCFDGKRFGERRRKNEGKSGIDTEHAKGSVGTCHKNDVSAVCPFIEMPVYDTQNAIWYSQIKEEEETDDA